MPHYRAGPRTERRALTHGHSKKAIPPNALMALLVVSGCGATKRHHGREEASPLVQQAVTWRRAATPSKSQGELMGETTRVYTGH